MLLIAKNILFVLIILIANKTYAQTEYYLDTILNIDSMSSCFVLSKKSDKRPSYPKLNITYPSPPDWKRFYGYGNLYINVTNNKNDTIFSRNPFLSEHGSFIGSVHFDIESVKQYINLKGRPPYYSYTAENIYNRKDTVFFYEMNEQKLLFKVIYFPKYSETINNQEQDFYRTWFYISDVSGDIAQCDYKNGTLVMFNKFGEQKFIKHFYPEIMPDSCGQISVNFAKNYGDFLCLLKDNDKSYIHSFMRDTITKFEYNQNTTAFLYAENGKEKWRYKANYPFVISSGYISGKGKYAFIYSYADSLKNKLDIFKTKNISKLTLINANGKIVNEYNDRYEAKFSYNEKVALLRGNTSFLLIECKTGKILNEYYHLKKIIAIDIAGKGRKIVQILGKINEIQEQTYPNTFLLQNMKLQVIDFDTNTIIWQIDLPDEERKNNYPKLSISDNGSLINLILNDNLYRYKLNE